MEAVGRTAGTALGGEGRQDSHPDRHHDEEEGEGGDGDDYAGGDGDQGNTPYRQRLDYHHHCSNKHHHPFQYYQLP